MNSVYPSGRPRLGDVVGGDGAVGAGAVLQDHGLAGDALELLGDRAADDVQRAAGGVGDHQP
jgi:hypothetical protein